MPIIEVGPLDRLRKAADLLMYHPFEIWHYGDSIGFEGLLAATDILGDPRYEAWVYGAIKGWIPRARPYRELDNTAPGHAMCQAYERLDDGAILEAAAGLASYLLTRRQVHGAYVSFEQAPLRAPYGGAQLSAEEKELLRDPGAGVFVDCLHFDAPFLAHLGRLQRDHGLLAIAAEQAAAHTALLQQPSGLFAHFWLERTEQSYGYGWGRGQGWALLGLLDVLEHLPPDHHHYGSLRSSFGRLAAALVACQAPDGGWPTVASEPSSPSETSTSAFVAAGLARGLSLGLLDESYAESAAAAWRHTRSSVEPSGSLAGVSAAVWASTAPSHYWNVPTGLTVPWGQGPLLLAAKRMAALGSPAL